MLLAQFSTSTCPADVQPLCTDRVKSVFHGPPTNQSPESQPIFHPSYAKLPYLLPSPAVEAMFPEICGDKTRRREEH